MKTERVPGYQPRPSREGLVVEAHVCARPIEVPTSLGLAPKLAVLCNSASSLIVSFCPEDGCLVGKEFRGFVGIPH